MVPSTHEILFEPVTAGRSIAFAGVVVAVVVAAAVVVLRKPPRPAYSPPRTPWGEPDLQGTYWSDGSYGVAFQRLQKYGTRATLTDSEYAELTKPRATPDNDVDFHEYGTPSRSTSIVIDPPDGRLPTLTAEGERLRAARPGFSRQNDAAELHSLFDRCITRGVVGSILPNIFYGNGARILQGPGYVVIQNEMVHESRLIPTSSSAPRLGPRLHLYMGDPRGHWEGDSLVVDSTNFTGQTDVGGALVTAALHLIERLTLTAPDTLHYEFTVDDPATYTAKWTGALDLIAKPGYHIYEYACHEGNYALANMMTGARSEEKTR